MPHPGRVTQPIDERDAAAFRDLGYLIVEGLFSRQEVAALQSTVESFKQQNLLYDQSVTAKQNYQLHEISACSRLCRALPYKPEVKACLSTLLGGGGGGLEILGDQMFLKPAATGQGTSWHQDNAYFRTPAPEEARGTGMWVAVHDADVENGTMKVIPGSHRHLLAHCRDQVSNHFISCEDDGWVKANEPMAVPATMAAGGVMFFSYNTAHSTGDNLSGRERAGLAFHVGQASLHDGGRAAPLSYPGPAGEGNDSAGQQDNEVIRILRGKAGAKGSAEVQEATAPPQAICAKAAADAAAAADQLAMLLAAGGKEETGSAGAPTAEAADSKQPRRWLTGPWATGGAEYYNEPVEGMWEAEVVRVLDGSAAADWADGKIGDTAQREMVARSRELSEGRFGRLPSSDLAPAAVALMPRL